jgi:ElaB/YqjD/DUF883 family membrane-anchored ribosome-binding protein
MITSTERSIEKSITEAEGRLRQSLEKAQTAAENRLKSLRQYLAGRPVRSVLVAFAVGVGFARLLQKIR